MVEGLRTLRFPLVPSRGSAFGLASAALYLAFIGLPIVALLIRAFQQESFLDTLTSDMALTALRLSLFTSIVSMAVVVALGTPFAYLLARNDNPWLRVVDHLVELPLVLPPVVAGVAMLMAFGRNGLIGSGLEDLGITIPFTTAAVVFAQIFVASPFFIRAAKLGFQSVPREYEDLAQTLGVSPWGTFFRVTLPLAGPAMFTGLGLAWARALCVWARWCCTMVWSSCSSTPGCTRWMPTICGLKRPSNSPSSSSTKAMPPLMPAPKFRPVSPSTTTAPFVMYSQPWSPAPSTTHMPPELRTQNRSPAWPAANSLPAVAP